MTRKNKARNPGRGRPAKHARDAVRIGYAAVRGSSAEEVQRAHEAAPGCSLPGPAEVLRIGHEIDECQAAAWDPRLSSDERLALALRAASLRVLVWRITVRAKVVVFWARWFRR